MKPILLLVLLQVLSFGAGAAVTKLSIPGGEVHSIVYQNTNTAYAATQGGGIYRSSDGGVNWQRLVNSPSRYVNELALGSSGTLYAASEDGVYSSANSGSTWTRRFSGRVSAIAVRPGTDNSYLFGVPGVGVYRVNSGSAPALSTAGLVHAGITSLAYDPAVTTTVYLGISSPCLDAGCNPPAGIGVFRSTDGGTNWTDITGNLGFRYVTALAVTSDRILFASTRSPAGCGPGGVHRLPSGSATWVNPTVETDGGLSGAEFVTVDRFDGASVWAGSCGIGLYRGIKLGNGTWSFSRQHGVGAPPAALLNAANSVGTSPGSNRATVAVRGIGMFTSANGRNGASTVWSDVSGLQALRATSFSGSPIVTSTYYVGANAASVLRSTNSGASWQRIDSGLPGLSGTSVPTVMSFRDVQAHPNDVNKVVAVAGGFGGFPSGLYQASSGAWSQPSGGANFQNPRGVSYTGVGDTVLVTNFDNQFQAGVFKGSASSGGFSSTLSVEGHGRSIPSRFVANRVYLIGYSADDLGTGTDGLGLRSSDSGSTWSVMTATHTGFMRLASFALAERDANNLVAATNKGLFGSSNGGSSWQRVSQAGIDKTVFSGLAYVGSTLFATSRDSGFFCSTNHGANWTDLSSSLPEAAVIVGLEVAESKLHLITDGAGLFAADPTCP